MSDDGDKRFDPTPQRREQYRKEGRVARARDAAGLASAICVLGVLMGSRAALSTAVSNLFHASLGNLDALARGQPTDALRIATTALAQMAGPAVVAGCAGAIVASLAQTGLHVNIDAIGFKPERFNPIDRLQQLFSPKKATVEMLLSFLRVGAVGYVAYRASLVELPDILSLARLPVDL